MNILQAHGMWVGECGAGGPHNRNGFFENRKLKSEIRRLYGIKRSLGVEKPHPQWKPLIMETLLEQGYSDGPWGFKTFVHYRHIWDDFKPLHILPRRASDAILQSTRRAGYFRWFDDDRLMEFIDSGQRDLDSIAKIEGSVEVSIDAILAGDKADIQTAVEAAGMTFNPDIVDRIIDPSQFHNTAIPSGSA